MAPRPNVVTVTYPPPPDELFDAQIEVAATLAANAALLQNAPLAGYFTQRWLHYAGPYMQAGNRIAIGKVAHFVEAELAGVNIMHGEPGAPEWRSGGAIEAAGEGTVGGESGLGETSGGGGSGGERSAAGAIMIADPGRFGLETPEGAAKRKKKEATRLKAMCDLFGARLNRGQNVLTLRAWPGVDVHNRALWTLPDDVASLYVVSQLVEASTTRARSGGGEVGGLPGLGVATWAKQREQWMEKGLDEKQAARCEAELQVKALRGLPIFVLKNGGTYYSSTMLKYVLGLENHAYQLFRTLRDVNRRMATESGGASADSDEEFGGGSGADAQTQFDQHVQEWEAQGGGFMVGQDVTQAPALSAICGGGGEGGANDAEAGTSAQGATGLGKREGGGTSLTQRVRSGAERAKEMQLLSRAAGADTPAELVSVLAASSKAFGLPFPETCAVTVMQVGQTKGGGPGGGGHGGGGCGLGRGGGSEEGEESEEEEDLDKSAPRDFSNIEGEVLEESFHWLQWGAKGKRSHVFMPAGDKEIWIEESEGEEDEWAAGGEPEYRTERPGLDPRAPVPFKGLGDIGRYWTDFSIPDQVVTMQASYDAELEASFKGRHNLWVLGAISCLFPQSVPITKTPAAETLFAVDVVRAAYPEMRDDAATLGTVALAASEGVEVTPEMRRGANSLAVNSLVRGARASKRLRMGELPPEWENLDEDGKKAAGEILRGISAIGKRARAEVAVRAADEDLRRLQPHILDVAGGAGRGPAEEEESEGEEEQEEEQEEQEGDDSGEEQEGDDSGEEEG